MDNQTITQTVAKITDLKDGEMKEVPMGEGRVLLVKDKGQIHAVGHKCTHYAAPLKNGSLCNGVIRCPWHGACFKVSTGDIEDSPGLDSLHKFEVSIEGENVIVTAPLAALGSQFRRVKTMCPASKEDGRIFVIIGGGAAGESCAESLRQEGFEGRIVMVCKEKDLPYDRPKLSKAMSMQTDKILLRNAEFYQSHGIEAMLGVEAIELIAEEKVVKLSNGESIRYDAALVASGAFPRTLPLAGMDSPNVFPLRNPADAHAILDRIQVDDNKVLTEGKRVVIVGSSFIGMETASCIVKKCRSIVVIGMESVPFERVLGPQVGAAMQKLHETNGISFRMKRTVKEFRCSDGLARGLILDNGEVLDADVIVIGAGVIPATKFVKGVTLERDQSIVADKHLKVADGLYAAGDLVRYPYHLTGESVRIEHWGMAQTHGRIAAKNMIGKGEPFAVESVPFFWTQQYGKNIRYCGWGASFDDVILDGTPESLNFLALFVKEDKVFAACSMNRDPMVAAVAQLLAAKKMPSATELKSKKVDLLQLASSITP